MENNLSVILGANLMSITELSKKSGVNRGTLTEIYYRRAKSVKLETLIRICDSLEIKLSELIEYTPKSRGEKICNNH